MENNIRTNYFFEENRKKEVTVEPSVQHTAEGKKTEILFTSQKLRDIKMILLKVSDSNDFVEILCEIVQMKINNTISKEKIDEMKAKWKQYKITKKQIVNIYKIL